MKHIRIVAMLAMLNAGLSKAGDYAATNKMPLQIHNLMEAEGYAIGQNGIGFPTQITNSLRNVQLIKKPQFIPLVLTTKKTGWSLWNNSSVKYVGRNTEMPNTLAPYASLSQYEYDITYSFGF